MGDQPLDRSFSLTPVTALLCLRLLCGVGPLHFWQGRAASIQHQMPSESKGILWFLLIDPGRKTPVTYRKWWLMVSLE